MIQEREIKNKEAFTVAEIVKNTWLMRYPWPTTVIVDRGTEFLKEFADMVKNDFGIKLKVITTRNPQANAIVEKVHQMIWNMVRTFEPENNFLDKDDPWKGTFSAVAFAVRATIHTTLQKTPAQLVFGRDIILNVTHVENQEHMNKGNKLSSTKTTRKKIPKESHTHVKWETKFHEREELKTNVGSRMRVHAAS